MYKTFLALVAGLLTAGTLLAAGTTGSLSGEVKNNDNALPGVTVTAQSPSQIGGAQVSRTDERGIFTLPRLAPGVYTVRFELEGFIIWDLNAQAMRQEINVFPARGELDTPPILDLDTGAYSNNYPNAQFSTRDRDELRTSLTYFLDGALGSHELKAGAEVSNLFFSSANNTPAGITSRCRAKEPLATST